MLKVRLIAHLEIKGQNVIKGIGMEGLRPVGSPDALMQRYFEQGADELILTDTVASLYGRNHLVDLVRSASERIFVALTVGGGVRSVADFHRLLSGGADKVSLNTQALKTPELITEAARVFGAQCVVASVQAKHKNGVYEPFGDNGRERTRREVVAWCRELQERGAGELLLTSIDRDGSARGLDVELIRSVSDAVSIPVIAAGGGRDADDIAAAVEHGGANAVALAHVLHFDKANIPGLKAGLSARGILVRPPGQGP